MQRRLKILIAVIAVGAILGAGVYEGYAQSTSSPCASVPTPAVTKSASSAIGVNQFIGGPGITSGSRSGTEGPASRVVTGGGDSRTPSTSPGAVINVVAAENFWGDLVSQIGGAHVNVTSIITDPNTDPHEYQSNASTARAIANAQYVIVNNVGYDSWATSLINADGATNQTVLNIGDSLGVAVGGGIVSGNPHLWYNPTYVNDTVAWMYHNLTAIAPTLTPYFTAQYDNLTASLGTLYSEVGLIKQLFAGTIVAATESIFVYLANATGLDLVSPPEFMEAVAEGNDPSDQSVVTFQCQLESGAVHVLVYNAQTVTPLTTSLKTIAQDHNVTVISVTETLVPPTTTFQSWMGGELNALYVALDAKTLGG